MDHLMHCSPDSPQARNLTAPVCSHVSLLSLESRSKVVRQVQTALVIALGEINFLVGLLRRHSAKTANPKEIPVRGFCTSIEHRTRCFSPPCPCRRGHSHQASFCS